MINVVKERIECLDNEENRKAVINNLVENSVLLGIRKSEVVDLVVEVLKDVPLTTLLSCSVLDVYTTTRKYIIDKFLNKYTEVESVSNAFANDMETIYDYFSKYEDLDDLYYACITNVMTESSEFEDYINEVMPNVLPDYTFNVVVAFEVENPENYTSEKIEGKIIRRIGKDAKYKWGACELAGIVVLSNNGKFDGKIALHIEGNASYTIDTIKQAIHNRLGANAKRRKWSDFKVLEIIN